MNTVDFLGFNPDEVEPAKSFDGGNKAIPEGNYKMVASKCAFVTNKDNAGKHWKFDFTVADGDFVGAEITERFNVVNRNTQAATIGQRQLAGYLETIGVKNPKSESDMLNIAFTGYVKCRKNHWTNKAGEKVESTQNYLARIDKWNFTEKVAAASSATPAEPETEIADDTPPWDET